LGKDKEAGQREVRPYEKAEKKKKTKTKGVKGGGKESERAFSPKVKKDELVWEKRGKKEPQRKEGGK